jgi:hypothetical protein
MNDKLGKTRKVVVTNLIKLLFSLFHGETKENHKETSYSILPGKDFK